MAKRKGTAAPQEPSFEQALERLEEIVRQLEESDLPLDESLAVFEEGVRLSRLLHEKLNEAERKVEILLRNEAGGKTVAPFGEDRSAAAPDAAADADAEEDGDAGERGDEGSGGAGQRRLF